MKIKLLWFWSILATLTVFVLGYFLQVQQAEIGELQDAIVSSFEQKNVVADLYYRHGADVAKIIIERNSNNRIALEDFYENVLAARDSSWFPEFGALAYDASFDTVKIKNVKTYPLNPARPDSAKIIVWQYIGTLGAGESVVDTLQF